MYGIYSQFGLCSNYLYNKNKTISYFTTLTWNMVNLAVSGPSSFNLYLSTCDLAVTISARFYTDNFDLI